MLQIANQLRERVRVVIKAKLEATIRCAEDAIPMPRISSIALDNDQLSAMIMSSASWKRTTVWKY